MKKSLLIPVALFATLPTLSAFSLDFNAFFESLDGGDFEFVQGTTDVLVVDGFGTINFFVPDSQPAGTTYPLSDSFGSGALELTDGQAIAIQFDQNDDISGVVSNVDITTIGGGSASFEFDTTNPSAPVNGVITFSGAPGGISVIDFDNTVVPEPSVSILGGLGMLALLRRRR